MDRWIAPPAVDVDQAVVAPAAGAVIADTGPLRLLRRARARRIRSERGREGRLGRASERGERRERAYRAALSLRPRRRVDVGAGHARPGREDSRRPGFGARIRRRASNREDPGLSVWLKQTSPSAGSWWPVESSPRLGADGDSTSRRGGSSPIRSPTSGRKGSSAQDPTRREPGRFEGFGRPG